MLTPPTLQMGMQTRSKTDAASDNTRKATRRQLFADEQSESKKKRRNAQNVTPTMLLITTVTC